MGNFKSSVSTLVLSAVVFSTLTLGGCNKKDKGGDVKTSAKIEKLIKRNISDAQAQTALVYMGLDKSGAHALTWSARVGNKGNYTFTNVAPEDADGGLAKLGGMEIKGLRMQGKQAVFDHISFTGFKADDDGTIVSLKAFALSQPTAGLAQAFAELFKGDEDAFDDIDGDFGFSALSFTGLGVENKDGILHLDGLETGKTKDGSGMFALHGFDMKSTRGDDNITLNLGEINVQGVNLEKYENILPTIFNNGNTDIGEETLQNMLASINPYDPDFKSMSLKDFHMNAGGLRIDLDSVLAKAEKKGGKIVMRQTMSPLTITPPKDSKDKDISKFADGLKTMGYDALVLTVEQNSILDEKTDSMKVSDSYIKLKDGFKLSFDYNMVGYKAYMQEAAAKSVGENKELHANPMAIIGMMNKLKVNSMRIELEDNSVVDRAFKLAADQQGGTPKALKAQAKMGLMLLPMAAKDKAQQKAADQLSKALGSWLEDGGSLILDLNPAEPIVMGDVIQGPMSKKFDVEKLGMTISHEK